MYRVYKFSRNKIIPIIFKMSVSGLCCMFFKYSSHYADCSLDILIKIRCYKEKSLILSQKPFSLSICLSVYGTELHVFHQFSHDMRTLVSVLKMSSLSCGFGRPTNNTLSSRPGLNTAGSMISTKTENTRLKTTLNSAYLLTIHFFPQ